jgi:SAM-dependent methyltransferase
VRKHAPVDIFEPSPNLKKVIDVIARDAPGAILDIPCGYGRNALPFAERGFDVYCVDIDQDALGSIGTLHTARPITGRLIPIAADLTAGPPGALAGRTFGAIINVHHVCPHFVNRGLVRSRQAVFSTWKRSKTGARISGNCRKHMSIETFSRKNSRSWSIVKYTPVRHPLMR